MKSVQILIVEDNFGMRENWKIAFQNKWKDSLPECLLYFAGGETDAMDICKTCTPDLAIVDHRLTDGSGLSVTKSLLQLPQKISIFVTTGYAMDDNDHGSKVYKDYSKLIEANRGRLFFREKAGKKAGAVIQELKGQIISAINEIDNQYPPGIEELFKFFPTSSIVMRSFLESLGPYLDSDTLFLKGKIGSGKTFLARTIHKVRQNLGMISNFGTYQVFTALETDPNLVRSALFGHVKGAFTGANSEKKGLIESTCDGTLLFDEIADLSGDLQGALLALLNDQEYRKVGAESKPIKTSAKFIFATHKNIENLIHQKRFRRDLYDRISIPQFSIPSLSERREDIVPLAKKFLAEWNKKHNKNLYFNDPVLDLLKNYDFPEGGVRKLKKIVTEDLCRQASHSRSSQISLEHFPGEKAKAVHAVPVQPKTNESSVQDGELLSKIELPDTIESVNFKKMRKYIRYCFDFINERGRLPKSLSDMENFLLIKEDKIISPNKRSRKFGQYLNANSHDWAIVINCNYEILEPIVPIFKLCSPINEELSRSNY